MMELRISRRPSRCACAAAFALLVASLPGCLAYRTTQPEDLNRTTASKARLAVVRFKPGDAYSALSALRVSNALASLAREANLFEETAYALAEDALEPADGRFVLRGSVTNGAPSKAINTNLIKKVFLKLTVLKAADAPKVGVYNYRTSVSADYELLDRVTKNVVRKGSARSEARGTYGELDAGDVEERVLAVAERNLAAEILRDVKGYVK
jgi:hypothetical protein